MSTRCHIEFKSGSAPHRLPALGRVSGSSPPDLLSFLSWSVRGGDVEYEAANFLHCSKRELDPRNQQLGFGVCQNDELHGDIEYYYLVEHTPGGVLVRAFEVEDGPRIGRCVDSLALPATSFFNSSSRTARMRALLRVQLHGIWYFRDDRLAEFRRCDNPHGRITFDELDAA